MERWTPGSAVQHGSAGVHWCMEAQWVTWDVELPDAICMSNTHSRPARTICPMPVVSEGVPTGIAWRLLNEMYTRPSGVTEPIIYLQETATTESLTTIGPKI